MNSLSVATNLPNINRQFIQRTLFNWRHQLGIDLTVEEHSLFRQNKKHYLATEELDPKIMIKMIQRFHPTFQFPTAVATVAI